MAQVIHCGALFCCTVMIHKHHLQGRTTKQKLFLQQHMRNVTSEWIDVQKSLEKLGEKQSVDILNFDLFHYRPTKVLFSSSQYKESNMHCSILETNNALKFSWSYIYQPLHQLHLFICLLTNIKSANHTAACQSIQTTTF